MLSAGPCPALLIHVTILSLSALEFVTRAVQGDLECLQEGEGGRDGSVWEGGTVSEGPREVKLPGRELAWLLSI